MREARPVQLAQLLLQVVDRCQRDLTACSDLVVECGGSELDRLEDPLHGVYRQLALLRVEAHRVAMSDGRRCRLVQP